MATVRTRRVQTYVSPAKVVKREEDADYFDGDSDDAMVEDRDPLDDSGCTRSDESDDDVEEEEAVVQDMVELESNFAGFNQRFRLLHKIGEGTPLISHKAIGLLLTLLQELSPQSTKRKICSMVSSRMTGTLRPKKDKYTPHTRNESYAKKTAGPISWPSRRSMSPAAPCES